MPEREQKKRELGSKLLTVFAIGTGLGFGMCSVSGVSQSDRVVDIGVPLGAGLFFVCLTGLLITIIVMALQTRARRRDR
jgi:hypothetical protein